MSIRTRAVAMLPNFSYKQMKKKTQHILSPDSTGTFGIPGFIKSRQSPDDSFILPVKVQTKRFDHFP